MKILAPVSPLGWVIRNEIVSLKNVFRCDKIKMNLSTVAIGRREALLETIKMPFKPFNRYKFLGFNCIRDVRIRLHRDQEILVSQGLGTLYIMPL